MTLPQTVSYTPDEPTWSNRLPWRLDPARSVLLVHDMQRYFTRVFAPDCVAYTDAVRHCAVLLDAARRAGVPVVYTAQPGDQPAHARGLLADRWGPGIGADPDQTDIVTALAPRPGETVLTKHRYSAFARTDLAERVRAAGRDQLMVCGIYGHIGIAATATDAFMLDIAPFVAADAVADFSAADHTRALHHVAATCGVVLTTADAVSAWTPPSAWDDWLATRLGRLLDDEAAGAALVAEPSRSVFDAGLDSVRAFDLLDELADLGVDVDFVDFATSGSTGFLLTRIARAGVATP
ncbi:bifunctional isochorismate lyase/aryl carrier protein [Mumia flava]|uniref:Bifunctional isochorismate lyase/aryl carrier protein n=1 Tax=Mumia flava TaxID=1348852 RepID=A0A2M9BK54_9ACTN|nr:isochorismatase family protein [Mumia flava]PJJ58334.1 bifunctional isochorismate lyase/aryl carrier protein [Mumia flava]